MDIETRIEQQRRGARVDFAPIEEINYHDMEALDTKKDADIIELWQMADNRSAKPDEFDGTLHVRREYVNPPLIMEFMRRTACRRAGKPLLYV